MFSLMILLSLTACSGQVSGQTYNHTMAILVSQLGGDKYHTEVRPLKDQSQVMNVSFQFYVESLVEINEVTQSFTCNGFLAMEWMDEMVAWEPANFGGVKLIHPLPESIWRPRVVLMNTFGERDIFGDNKAPVYVFHDGKIRYVPGALFPTSCEFHLVKFPFDQQDCTIGIASMSQIVEELQFVPMISAEVSLDFFVPHVEWHLVSTSVEVINSTNPPFTYPIIRIHFSLKRRPAFLLLNVILPVVFLSFLNILVFMIPAESGEKIGYGITVLLALAVFLSIVSTMLPRSSSSLPRLTIYLFILLVISLLTVVDSIIIVYIHKLQENEARLMKAQLNFKAAFTKLTNARKVAFMSTNVSDSGENSDNCNQTAVTSNQDCAPSSFFLDNGQHIPTMSEAGQRIQNKRNRNKYKTLDKYIDLVSFFAFFIVFVVVTIGFMLDITSVILA